MSSFAHELADKLSSTNLAHLSYDMTRAVGSSSIEYGKASTLPGYQGDTVLSPTWHGNTALSYFEVSSDLKDLADDFTQALHERATPPF